MTFRWARRAALVFVVLSLGCDGGAVETDAGLDAGAIVACTALTPADQGRRCAFDVPCVREWTSPERCGVERWTCEDGHARYEDATQLCADAGVDDGGMDGGTDGGVDANVEPIACGGGRPPFMGELCGAGSPCRVLEDRALADAAFRNGSPSVAVGLLAPAVVFSTAEGGYTGHYASPRDGWTVETLPRPLALGAVVFRNDEPFVASYDGERTTALLARTSSAWSITTSVPGLIDAASVAADVEGCVHLVRSADAGGPLVHSRFDGRDWTHRTVSTGGVFERAALTLDASGTAHVVWYETGPTGWRLRWRAGDGPVEDVDTVGGGLEDGSLALAVVGEVPHVLHVDVGGQVRYSTRGPGGWSSRVLAAPRRTGCDPSVPPSGSGETCVYRRITPRVVGLAPSTSGVRALYALTQEDATLTSDCTRPGGGPPPACAWTGASSWSGVLQVANETDPGVEVLGSVAVGSGNVAVDGVGQLHVALYTLADDGGGLGVRYLRLGP